ncbi:alpha-L-arabinofuranosidase C-terminal domain-containing protein [Danxiaibacter flavus]|uniref:non-reducing end alpha-L-arabinofuranosidase n=1 Tax=Danxiaibacter flavus TaxID=3049108 RepID=A0ABV3ZCI8_9BACT|nr:alpha-L-arabinofuranosidase C-terminal domain-containing protein [Chitinophagaceae bacterium DXS]
MRRSCLVLVALIVLCNCLKAQSVQLTVNTAGNQKINKEIYGHFAEHLGRCIYDGFWVDEKMNVPKQGRIRMDVVNALKKIKLPLLRWPGGCFADQYHWSDGIGPVEKRPKTVNSNWGMVSEDNSFGTHEFLQLCDLIGCEPYIAGNMGSGTPQEMSNWIEYLNFNGQSALADLRRKNGHDKPYNVAYWGVGNESWGCGGDMTPEYYTDNYKQYAAFCKNYPGAPLKKVASGANSEDYNWTEVCMKNIHPWQMWGISMHYYTVVGNWEKKGSATEFNEEGYFKGMKNCLHIEDLINKHSAIMDKYDPQKKVALAVDEWGIWTDAEPGTNPAFLYQQNSLRDALVAASSLNIFNNHCDRVKMANLAQTVNVLQALILTDKEKMLLTPTYHVFDLYKVHQDATLLPLNFTSPDYTFGSEKIPAINASASKDASGAIHITLVNIDPTKKITVNTSFGGANLNSSEAQIVTSGKFTDINTFDQPNKVKAASFSDFKKNGNQLSVNMPPMSVVLVTLK